MRAPILLLLLAATLVPTAAADAAPVVLVTDASGDARPAGAASSPTHRWADLTAAELQPVGLDKFTLRLRVADTGSEVVDGVVLLNFETAKGKYFMGYAALVFPAPPFRHVGGFYCPSDGKGNPTGPCPDLGGASYTSGVFTIPDVARATFGLEAPGAALLKPMAESGNHVGALYWVPSDGSEVGRTYTFPLPNATQAAPTAPIVRHELTASKEASQETVAAPAALVVIFAVVALVLLRRR